MLTLLTSALAASLAVAAETASADILASPFATKICSGYGGGGISWSINLNEGWRPSALVKYRVILRDPRHRVIGARESYRLGGGWVGPFPYWDKGDMHRNAPVATGSLGAPTPGIYTFALQLRVDPRYPDIARIGRNNFDWPKHAGHWVTRTWRIHVYTCR